MPKLRSLASSCDWKNRGLLRSLSILTKLQLMVDHGKEDLDVALELSFLSQLKVTIEITNGLEGIIFLLISSQPILFINIDRS